MRSIPRRTRLLTIVLAVATVLAGVPLFALAGPAAAATDIPWYAKGIVQKGDQDCTAYDEPCYLLYNEKTNAVVYDTSGSGSTQYWIAQPKTSSTTDGEFMLKNAYSDKYSIGGKNVFLASRGCLNIFGTAYGFWHFDSADINADCPSADRNIWHLLPVEGRSGKYLLQNRDGDCFRFSKVVNSRLGMVADCDITDPGFWWTVTSPAQARTWGALAVRYAQSVCDRNPATCSFVPAARAMDTPPQTVTYTCSANDVYQGNLTMATKKTITVKESRTSTAGGAQEQSVAAEAAGKAGPIANIKASYAQKWSSTYSSSSTREVTNAEEITIPAGQFAWIYTINATGALSGTYTYYIGKDWKWVVDGTLDVNVTGGSSARVLAWGSMADYTEASFDCRTKTALILKDRTSYVTGFDDEVDGAPRVGQTVSVKPGTWIASGAEATDATVTYQWMRGEKVIDGATSQEYRVRPADLGKELWVSLSAAKTGSATGHSSSMRTNAVLPASASPATPSAVPSATPTPRTSVVTTPTPTPTPTSAPPGAPSSAAETDAPRTTPTAAADPDAEEVSETSVSVTVAQKDDRPVLTVRVRADAPGLSGEIRLFVKNADGTETPVTTTAADGTPVPFGVPVYARQNWSVATTTVALPATVASGRNTFAVRFVSADPAQFAGSETDVTLDVPAAG
jgi:hypothetical protein